MDIPNPEKDLAVIGKIARRMCVILLGYAAAVAIASFVTLLAKPAMLFTPAIIAGMIITAFTAAPAMLCFIAFSEIRYRVGPGGHVLAGTLAALAAHGVLGTLFGGGDPHISQLVGFSTLGGAVGGWTYWRIAVAHLQDAVAPWYESERLTLPAR